MKTDKEDLENQIKKATDAIKNQLGQYGSYSKNAMLIGGLLVAAYAITKLFDEEEEVVKKVDTSSGFSSALSGVALSLALTFAKTKLQEYLEKDNNGTA